MNIQQPGNPMPPEPPPESPGIPSSSPGRRSAFAVQFWVVALFILGTIQWGNLHWVPEGEDVYYAFVEGRRMCAGENPYARILTGDMRQNLKYATYLPGFYLLSATAQKLGLDTFASWVFFWRWIFFAAHLAAGWILFQVLWRRGFAWLAVAGAALFLFNRWSLYVLRVAHLDPPALLCLIGALVLLPRRPAAACFLYGVSLAIKHLGVFLLPLFLLFVWHRAPAPERWKAAARALAFTLAAPILVSIPFFAWNPEAFIRSMLFSLTRAGSSHFSAPSLDPALGLSGAAARLPMLVLMAAVLLAHVRNRLPVWSAAFLILIVFVYFNSVLFRQYLLWPAALLPLALADMANLAGRVGERRRQGLQSASAAKRAEASGQRQTGWVGIGQNENARQEAAKEDPSEDLEYTGSQRSRLDPPGGA